MSKLSILVFGIERKGLNASLPSTEGNGYSLVFEPYTTPKRFQDFDGVILFQGIFERIKRQGGDFINDSHWKGSYDIDDLDRRRKELTLLLEKPDSFACFILCERFENIFNTQNSDLVRSCLNISSFHKDNFERRNPNVSSKREEFSKFIKEFGAANCSFTNYNDNLDLAPLAVTPSLVGFTINRRQIYLPTLVPTAEQCGEYFNTLASSICTYLQRSVLELPQWASKYEFPEEPIHRVKISELEKHYAEIDKRLELLNSFKRILVSDGPQLVEDVGKCLEKGFKFSIDTDDQFIEDLKIVDSNNKPIVLVEVKGTTRGVKREHVNQADNHRERHDFQSSFPTLLLMNTNRGATELDGKDDAPANDQIIHSVKINVLIMRTLDLLRMLRLHMEGGISSETFLNLLLTSNGWLRVQNSAFEVIHELKRSK